MKIARVIPALLLACVLVSQAAAHWSQTTGPETGPVTALSVNPSDGHVFAIGNGSLYRSSDGGTTWVPLFTGLSGDLEAQAVTASASNIYAAGSLPTGIFVYRSIDDGDHWTQAGTTGLPAGAVLRALRVVGGSLFAGVEGNGVYRSVDAGDSWSSYGAGLPAGLGVGFFAGGGSDLYAGSAPSSSVKGIYRSTDGGLNWNATNAGFLSGSTLVGLSVGPSGVFAATDVSGLYRSPDAGATWVKKNPDAPTNFLASALAAGTNVFVGTSGGNVYRTDANGDNWNSIHTGLPVADPDLAIASFAVSGANLLAATGKIGVYRSTNSGDSWSLSNGGLRAGRVNGILPSPPLVFVAIDEAGFYCTPSDGNFWVEVDNGIAPYAGWYCMAQAGTTLLGGTGSGTLYRSDDNGSLWNLSSAGLALSNTRAFVIEGSTVYAGGYHGVARSTNSGVNWTMLSTGFGPVQTVLALWKSGSYILAGASMGMKRSVDAGTSWNAAFSGLPSGPVSTFAQLDATVFAGTSLGVFKSMDHGATWVPSSVGLADPVTSLRAVGGDLFAASPLGVFHSRDGGATWDPFNEGFPVNLPVNELAANATYLFAGTTRNGVWRFPISEVLVGVDHDPSGSSIALQQNHPNPTRSGTWIDYSLPRRTHVRIEVFGVAGERISTLVDGEVLPGAHQVFWDGTDHGGRRASPGVYLYRLSANGETTSKKMILFP